MTRRSKRAIKIRQGAHNMEGYQVVLDPAPVRIATDRKRPSLRRALLVAGTSAEMWAPILLGLFFAGALQLLP
jgi:hypothetical protein